MNVLKRVITVLLVLCLSVCAVGCAEEKYDEYDNFKPAGVLIMDCLTGKQYETHIDDEKYANIMFNAFEELTIDTKTEGEVGSAYLYMRFYDEDQSTMVIFTIYDNGSCCLGEDFTEYYTVENGRQKYIDLCELYEEYVPKN